MDLNNLNKVIEQLKKVNEEVIESKKKSNFDLRVYNDLKAKYSVKTKELIEAKEEIKELKRFTQVLNDKLCSLGLLRLQNQRLLGKVKRLKTKLDLVHKDNRFYLNELDQVKALLTSKTSTKNDKVQELQRLLEEKEKEYQENLEQIRNETKNSLITLESKIVTKLKTETCNFNYSLIEDDIKKRLNETESVIKTLKTSNLRLKEKLTLKNRQYRELEENYLRLKIESQRKNQGKIEKIKKKNHMYGDIKSETSWKLLKTEDIDDISKEIDETNDYVDNSGSIHDLYMVNEGFKLSDDSCESENDEKSSTFKKVCFEDKRQTLKLDFKQNEISVEVKNCCENV